MNTTNTQDPTDPGYDVEVLREHVRHLERRVRQLHAAAAQPQGDTREAFERWVNEYDPGCNLSRDEDNDYICLHVDRSWQTWQAASIQASEPSAEPIAWGAFYFGGQKDGQLYTFSRTRPEVEKYIQQVHQSSDSITLRPAPIYAAPPRAVEPLTYNEIKQMGSEWLNNGTTDHFDLMQQAIDTFCRKNGIPATTPTQAAQGASNE